MVDRLADDAVNRSEADLPPDQLAVECRRYAVLLYLAMSSRGWAHAFEKDAIVSVRERRVDGATVTGGVLNPAIEADRRTNSKLCALERKHRLYPSSDGRT